MATKPVVADASSLILLAKSELLEPISKRLTVIVPLLVYEEAVVRGKAQGHADALTLEVWFQTHKLQVKEPQHTTQQMIERLFGLRAGERDALALAYEVGISDVLIDDKKGINACKALGLRPITVLALLVALRKRGIISRAKALRALDLLERHGWYGHGLIQQARSDLDAR